MVLHGRVPAEWQRSRHPSIHQHTQLQIKKIIANKISLVTGMFHVYLSENPLNLNDRSVPQRTTADMISSFIQHGIYIGNLFHLKVKQIA